MSNDPTLDTYNTNAEEFVDFFAGIGSRKPLIDRAIELCGVTEPHVLELGCGDGRDARDILAQTPHYLGIDYAKRFIDIAKRTNPQHTEKFRVADMRKFLETNHDSFDIVFAFAAILHLRRDELAALLPRLVESLSPNGLIVLTSKYAAVYKEDLQNDRFGSRWFYYYHPDEILAMMPDTTEAYPEIRTIGSTTWFELIVKRHEA